jgi:hypothetical protein
MPLIKPLSAVSRDKLIDYLEQLGTPREIAEWKYFDESFNAGAERGFTVVDDGEVLGFIGVIPVDVRVPGGVRRFNWSCDWSASKQLQRPYGLRLLDAATNHVGSLIAFGGSEVTQKILQRLAASRDENAGLVFRRHLTLDAYVAWLEGRRIIPAGLFGEVIRRIAIPSFRRSRPKVTLTRGLPGDPFPVLSGEAEGKPSPVFDRAALDWRLTRCPGIEAWTCATPGNRAVVLFWRAAQVLRKWKLALFSADGETELLVDCITVALREIAGNGGASAYAIVSRWNATSIAALRAAGFSQTGLRYPVQVLKTNDNPDSIETLSGLSYLDNDLFHRF